MEDVLRVQYPHLPLVTIPERLRAITCQLNAALERFEDDVPANVTVSGDFLHPLHARISFVNETLALA